MSTWARVFLSLSIAFLTVGCVGGTAPPSEYVGALEQEFVGDAHMGGGVLADASLEAVASLGDLVPDGATVQVAEISWEKNAAIAVYLVLPGEGDSFLVADGDRSGSFEASEKSVLTATQPGGTSYETTVTLTLDDGPIPTYDMVVGWRDYSGLELKEGQRKPDPRLLANRPVVEGTVEVDGHEVRVKVPYSFETGTYASGYQYLDANVDGAYDTTFTSREAAYQAVAKVGFEAHAATRPKMARGSGTVRQAKLYTRRRSDPSR